MDAESYRNNWQNLSEKLRAKYSNLTEADLNRAETSESDLLDLMNTKFGLDHEEARKNISEFMSSGGKKVAPTVDPPNVADPQEDTAPPR